MISNDPCCASECVRCMWCHFIKSLSLSEAKVWVSKIVEFGDFGLNSYLKIKLNKEHDTNYFSRNFHNICNIIMFFEQMKWFIHNTVFEILLYSSSAWHFEFVWNFGKIRFAVLLNFVHKYWKSKIFYKLYWSFLYFNDWKYNLSC